MRSLFIIGNGFDLAHGLKTSYEDFHHYLKTEYPNANGEEYFLLENLLLPDGEEYYDDEEVVSFLLRIISDAEPEGELWSNLENSMGVLDFGEWLDFATVFLDKDGDPDYWKNMYNVQDIALNLVVPTIKISEFFSEWINAVKVGKNINIKPDFKSLINKDYDLFLSFNYTKTLEILYGVSKVCHIHGAQGCELLFGHGNDDFDDEAIMTYYTGAEGAISEIHYALRKNTSKAMEKHKDFFNSLSPAIGKIYSYGFSFSAVDLIYIREICKRLPSDNIIWFLNDYDSPKRLEYYKEIIRSCGFRGKFATYKIR